MHHQKIKIYSFYIVNNDTAWLAAIPSNSEFIDTFAACNFL